MSHSYYCHICVPTICTDLGGANIMGSVRAKGYDNWNFWEKAEATLREENGAFTVTQ